AGISVPQILGWGEACRPNLVTLESSRQGLGTFDSTLTATCCNDGAHVVASACLSWFLPTGRGGLFTRHGHDWAGRFPLMFEVCARVKAAPGLICGGCG